MDCTDSDDSLNDEIDKNLREVGVSLTPSHIKPKKGTTPENELNTKGVSPNRNTNKKSSQNLEMYMS